MKFRYLPMTEEDRQEMLSFLGLDSIEELFAEIPQDIRFEGELNLPPALAEPTLVRHMHRLAKMNTSFDEAACFLGAGAYDHYIPSVVGHMTSRSEFYTAYTPYQAEVSQGELQAIFEFQTMISELTGMEVANSSMYDGATALAEAAGVAYATTRKRKILVSAGVHPEARAIISTQAKGLGLEVVTIPCQDGVTDLKVLDDKSDNETAAVLIQSPNFFGNIEDLKAIEPLAHRNKGLFVVSTNPMSLGVLTPPGKFGADIVVGEAQPLGIAVQFGGPHCGFFTTTKKLMRRIPGRIVGQTVDENGKRGFVLTLQAREQHIRREKATSNICSNQALNALGAAVYLSALGKAGFKEVSELNLQKAHYAKQRLTQIPGVSACFTQPFFNEFALKLPLPVAQVNKALLAQGMIGGYDLGRVDEEYTDCMLIAVTELRTQEEIEAFARVLEGLV
ncbi:aminomethyl-transferring glycine dehydrogenase subunit GcvPA [Mechercharimyces sp. CAU 1602]|uniref:aminomethyl-transferring glycine dehydrogenase subunit GcvPA n=1 Tax=Mechercharimyces sp. CAU 1602 TaxID=2973933 RepID=UPI002161203D|nr:aminomethyl-transferring glycine dehydrogenase subunit GcvPA [Mechercharimyces sp. CAU 1602]MCS1350714.1 aminomethyl-transferring glycine dehydrogenase subunit GcvPA [Mechercharimyces sp. CAU 1602]